jgi:hypothetical protein
LDEPSPALTAINAGLFERTMALRHRWKTAFTAS